MTAITPMHTADGTQAYPVPEMDQTPLTPDPVVAQAIFDEHQQQIFRRTDRLFAHLMGAQWVAGIVFALWVSLLLMPQ